MSVGLSLPAPVPPEYRKRMSICMHRLRRKHNFNILSAVQAHCPAPFKKNLLKNKSSHSLSGKRVREQKEKTARLLSMTQLSQNGYVV